MFYQNQTYVENEGTYYHIKQAGANYTTARSICKDDFQSQLAVLNTQELFDKAKSLSGAGPFYIGLHRPNNAAKYQWLDGSAFDPSLINGPNITNGNAPGCRGVVMQVPGKSNPVDLIAYDCNSGQNVLCFTPAQLTTTTTSTEEATTATRAATTSQAIVSTTSYDTTTTTLSPTTNTVLTKVQPTTQLYNSTQSTTTGLTNTQSANAGGLQLGIVVGIPLGVVLLLILLIALIVWLKRRGGDKSNEADVSLENKGQDPPTGTYNRADVGNEDDQREVHLNVLYDTGANDATNNEEDEEADIGDLYAKVNKQPVQKQQQDYGESYDVLHENNTTFIAEAEELYSGLNKT